MRTSSSDSAVTAADDEAARLTGLLSEDEGWFPRYRRWLVLALVLLALASAAYVGFTRKQEAAAPRYRTETAAVRKLVVTISATGNVQPTNQVDVSSELSGIVEQVFVDDNDRVRKGQLLAQLDLSRLEDAVARSQANLETAEAQVSQAQATTAETRANLTRFRQLDVLSGSTVPSRSELDTVEATAKRAEASEAAARAAVSQAHAALKSDSTNLEKARIRSPINGVVLTRKVEPGQTVAASFQAPVLFTIAEDLAKMELQVDIDEADVGQVKIGQKANFGVDAWPGRIYQAVIERVGYGSQLKDGVVSYPAVLQVANVDLSLRPGMTGTAQITTLMRESALVIPNAALRYVPATEALPAETQAAPARSGNVLGALLPSPPAAESKTAAPAPDAAGMQRIWVLRDGAAVAVQVTTGATDGRVTEVTGGELQAGMEVITEAVVTAP